MTEMRANPRTAWTRSSSPGPESTTRVSRITPPSQIAIASACAIPSSRPSAARDPSTRPTPIIATASAGIPSAAACVAGSRTRSGRNATHADAMTKINRNSAARPAQPASKRSNQAPGLKPEPSELPVTAAAAAEVKSTVPMSARTHAARKKRTVIRYSTPSGHAAAMRTNAPNTAAMPSVDSTRPSHSGPVPVSTRLSATVLVSASPPEVVAGADADVEPLLEVLASSSAGVVVAAGSASTVNESNELPFGSPSESLTRHVATQSPRGSASGIATVITREFPLSVGAGRVIGSVLHSSETMRNSPISSVKLITICVGEVARVVPSAGSDVTTSFSAWATPGSSVSKPIRTAVKAAAVADIGRLIRRRAKRPPLGTEVRLLTVRRGYCGLTVNGVRLGGTTSCRHQDASVPAARQASTFIVAARSSRPSVSCRIAVWTSPNAAGSSTDVEASRVHFRA